VVRTILLDGVPSSCRFSIPSVKAVQILVEPGFLKILKISRQLTSLLNWESSCIDKLFPKLVLSLL
jgi:hypothetical protein